MAASLSAVSLLSAGFSASTGLNIKAPLLCSVCGNEGCLLHSNSFAGTGSGLGWAVEGIHSIFSPLALILGLAPSLSMKSVAPMAAHAQQVQPYVAPQNINVTKLSVNDLFFGSMQLQSTYAGDEQDDQIVEVNVYMLKSHQLKTVEINTGFDIRELRRRAATELNLDPDLLMLIYNGNQLKDGQIIKRLGIGAGCKIHSIKCSSGERTGIFALDPESLAPRYDFDFTNVKDNNRTYQRGDFEYRRPYGWKRYAVKVLGEYENDDWLGKIGTRTETTPKEWPVSYHGTKRDNVRPILEEGYRIGQRVRFGPAVYTTPYLTDVMNDYAKVFEFEGKKYRLVLQNRVNPKDMTVIESERTKEIARKKAVPYWLSELQDPDSGVLNVRPYGVLTQEVQ